MFTLSKPTKSSATAKATDVLLGFVDIDATSVISGTPFKDRPDVYTSVINEDLFKSLQTIYRAAKDTGVEMAFAFTTNRARNQTFQDLLFKYAALRDSDISPEMALEAMRRSTIIYLNEYVNKGLGLPFEAVAVIFDATQDPVKTKSGPSSVGCFFRDVLAPIEVDMLKNCEAYYQQLNAFKIKYGLVSRRGEHEEEFENRILQAMYAQARPESALVAKVQQLRVATDFDHTLITKQGVSSKTDMFRNVEPFLLGALDLAGQRVKLSSIWADDYLDAIFSAVESMRPDERERLLLLHINHALGEDHSANLLEDFVRQVTLRTGWFKGNIFTDPDLNALSASHFPQFADHCCFTGIKTAIARATSTAEVSLFTPRSAGMLRLTPPSAEAGDDVFVGLKEVMTPTPSPRRKEKAAGLGERRHAAAVELPLRLSQAEGPAKGGPGTPETIASTPVTIVGTPGSTLSTAPTPAAGRLALGSFSSGLSGPRAAVPPRPPVTAKGVASPPPAATPVTRVLLSNVRDFMTGRSKSPKPAPAPVTNPLMVAAPATSKSTVGTGRTVATPMDARAQRVAAAKKPASPPPPPSSTVLNAGARTAASRDAVSFYTPPPKPPEPGTRAQALKTLAEAEALLARLNARATRREEGAPSGPLS